MKTITKVFNVLFAVMLCLVLFGQTARKNLPDSTGKDTSSLKSKERPAEKIVVEKPDSIEILKGVREGLVKENLQSLSRTERKIDLIPILLDRIILKERRNNALSIERITLPAYYWPLPVPEYKPDTTIVKKKRPIEFLGFSVNDLNK